MKTKTIYWIIGVIIVVGLIWWLVSRSKKNGTTTSSGTGTFALGGRVPGGEGGRPTPSPSPNQNFAQRVYNPKNIFTSKYYCGHYDTNNKCTDCRQDDASGASVPTSNCNS